MNCCLKCDVHEKNPHSGVHVEVIQVTRWTSAVNLSYDRIDFIHVRYNCWRHMKIMLPFPVSSFRINWISRSSGRNKFLHHFFLANAPGFRFRKITWFLTCVCCGRFPCYSVHQPAKFLISSFPCIRFPWNSEYPRALWWRQVHCRRLWFCHNSFLFFLFLHPLRHRFWAAEQAGILRAASGAEMADVEQMKKIVPFVTCEIAFGQNVCKLMFGVDVPDLNQTTNPKQLCGFWTRVSVWDSGLWLSS